jgi:hypothetical protein
VAVVHRTCVLIILHHKGEAVHLSSGGVGSLLFLTCSR